MQFIQEDLLLKCNMLESTDPDLAHALKDARDQEYHSVLKKEVRVSGIPPLDLGFVQP